MDWKSHQNEWRSITPEREFGIFVQGKTLITEPAENKQTAKSLSQENNSNKTSINRLLVKYENHQPKFQKPLNHMLKSINNLRGIENKITTIIAQSQQINSKSRISRPQSDLNVFEKLMMKKSSQNDISLSTNLNLNHSYVENRGETVTERSYLNNQKSKKEALQKKHLPKEQNKFLKKIIEKKIGSISQSTHDVFTDYFKQQQKLPKEKERSHNIQKYINLKFLRNSSGIWSSDKSDNNKRMSSYYTQNHYSKSHSSFLNERENSKSENTTSRNNRIRVSSYIKTPTKNNNELIKQLSPRIVSQQLSSNPVSSSKINSLLSTITKDIDKTYQINSLSNISNISIYHLQTIPLFIQNDPNQTHIIVCNSDLTVRAINLYSGRIAILGKHQRKIRSITKVVIQQNCKIFYTSSQDGQVIQWVSESMHGTYKLYNSWRMSEPVIQLYQTDKGILYMLTANNLYYYSSVIKKEIPLRGFVKCVIQTPLHVLVAIDDMIYKLQNEVLVPQIQLQKSINTMIYEDAEIYVHTIQGNILVLSDSSKIQFVREINLNVINIYNMNDSQILLQIADDELAILQNSTLGRTYQINGKISSLLACSQLLLIGTTKKLIETIKI